MSVRCAFGRALVLLALVGAPPVRAADGVLEINQTCASGAGCFSGDAAGYPVEITGAAGRSYLLTSDLTVPNANTHGILISGTTRGVTIDLGGFAILGPTSCVGTPAVCVGGGTGSGITTLGTAVSGVHVFGGSVRGVGNRGLNLPTECQVERVMVVSNGGVGLVGGSSCRIDRVSAIRNGAVGILASEGSVVTRSVALGNALSGYEATGVVRACVARQNGFDGILAGFFSTANENAASANTNSGIRCTEGCLIRGNAVYANGADGINCGLGCSAQANAAYGNGDFGLDLSGLDVTYQDNTVVNNVIGAVDGGTARGGNHCVGAGVATPPDCP